MKLKFSELLLWFLCITIFSCNSNKKVLEPLVISGSKTFITPAFSYSSPSVFATIKNENFCTFFFDKKNAIIGFKIEEKSPAFIFKLPASFAENKAIGSLVSYYIHNFDSVFLLHDFQLSLVDSAGNIKYIKPINQSTSEKLPDTLYGNFGKMVPLVFQPANNTLNMMQYSGQYDRDDKMFFTIPVEACFSLKSEKFTPIPMYFPQMYRADFYGELAMLHRVVNKNLHVYSFAADPDIYTYDVVTRKKASYNCRSVFDTVPLKPLSPQEKDDMNRKVDHLALSPFYSNILYDKYRDCYYRFFSKPMKQKKPDGSYNSWSEKQTSVIILDNHFNVVREHDLGTNYNEYFSGVAPEGLLLSKNTDDNNEKSTSFKFTFDILQFVK